MSVFLGSENNDGVLMYLIHRGFDQITNQVHTAANDVWITYNDHPNASLYGVAETNALTFPDAEILAQTDITTFPTLLFIRVEDNQMTAILSRITGGASYNKIKKEFVRLLEAEESAGEGSGGADDWFEAQGKGGLGIGLGRLFGFNCPKYLPDWICNFPVILLVLLIILAAFFIKKIIN